MLAGLGLALGFRAGLFNIGAEGQLLMGGMAAVIVGVQLPRPAAGACMLPLALLAGALAGGALRRRSPGWLRAATGAHEVISTIMLNLISYRLLDYLLRQPFIQTRGPRPTRSRNRCRTAAELPRLLDWIDPNLRRACRASS